jgi:hypothetical protein
MCPPSMSSWVAPSSNSGHQKPKQHPPHSPHEDAGDIGHCSVRAVVAGAGSAPRSTLASAMLAQWSATRSVASYVYAVAAVCVCGLSCDDTLESSKRGASWFGYVCACLCGERPDSPKVEIHSVCACLINWKIKTITEFRVADELQKLLSVSCSTSRSLEWRRRRRLRCFSSIRRVRLFSQEPF